MDSTLDLDHEIKSRKRIVKNREIKRFKSRKRWTLKVNTLRRPESFEMWTFPRILRIPWTDHIRNEEGLRRKGMYGGHI